jgi:FtsZ-interacting cell division protein ZipA
MASWLWIVIIVVLVAIVVAAVMAARRRRTMALRQRFGTEYDRTLDARDGQRAAEADLRGRERERARLDIKPLSEASRARYAGEWRAAQQSFVDQPEAATAAAYDLVNRVMAERGYPMRDFDARADLVSVDHPDVVENYRVAHGIHERAQHQQASTEDLREAMIRYRSLFEELLGADGGAAVPAGTGPAGARYADEKPASPAPARPASDEPARSRTARDGEVSDDAR